jgi:RNA polymerase sigma-70 factor, ECF subfamily
MTEKTENVSDEFVRLLTASQRRLYAYIFTILADSTAANEVLSDANNTLWEKRSEFQLGTDFIGWALSVAYYRILAYQKQRRSDRLVFDAELLEGIAEAAKLASADISERQSALVKCLEKLTAQERQLLNFRYKSGMSLENLARHRGKSVNAIAQALYRLRTALMECINRTLEAEPSQ